MGILSWLRLSESAVEPDQRSGPRFAIDSTSIDPAVFGLTSYASPIARMPRVSRAVAIQVGAVKRMRDLVPGAIGLMPIQTYNAKREKVSSKLLEQPERHVAAVITFTRTLEDMYFEGVAWWRITEWTGEALTSYPLHVVRLDPRTVQVKENQVMFTDRSGDMQGAQEIPLDDREVIRFDSPTDGLLLAGARAIRTSLMLDSRGYQSAENPVPTGFFSPKEGVDPFDDEPDEDATDEEKAEAYTAKKWLAQWATARAESTTAYVPAGLTYEQLSWDPEKLQLDQARTTAVIELARHGGVDPEDLGVSTTSRTYFNAETKRRDKLDFTLLQFIKAFEGRLSMADVTPRGQYVKLSVDSFLRTDTLARYQAYREALALDLMTDEEIRALEDLPPRPKEAVAVRPTPTNVTQMPAPKAPALTADPLALSSAAADIQLDAEAPASSFSVDLTSRTIKAIVIPYGRTAVHKGVAYSFSKGSVVIPDDVSRVKLLRQHDPVTAFGYTVEFEDTDEGLLGTFKVGRGAAGDEALILAEDRIWDGVSAGLGHGTFVLRDGVQHAVSVPISEVSLTPTPAFADSRVTSVALTADTEGNTPMTETTVVPAASTEAPTAALTLTAESSAQFASDLAGAIGPAFAELMTQALHNGQPPEGREVVSATGQQFAQLTVNEELPYRFDGSSAGEHCFTDDLRDMWMGSQDAKTRLDVFLEEAYAQFAVTKANSAAFNPVQNRPELYVPQLRYARPLWDLVSTGTLTDITAFTIPKFSSASGMVGPHTEGVEPTPGAFAATVQTVTPTAVSGKVEINREVWDQGGNPKTDTIVWQEMVAAYFEASETGLATLLNGLSAATLYTGAEINLAGAVDGALDDALTGLFTDLQFVRGGNRYTAFAADGQLYKAIVQAKDDAGRPLYPLLGPANANGQVAPIMTSANVGGQQVRPAWALGATVASNSYLFVPSSVWAWMSAPKRFTFEYQVKSVDMAVWGYTASAVLRNSDVARIDYTTADA